MKLPAATLLVVAAAGCNASGGNEAGRNASPGAPAAAVSMRTGLWETTMRIVSLDAPAAPPEIQAQLRGVLATAPVIQRSCLTPAEAADPASAIRGRAVQGQGGLTCQSGETLFANGRIRMTLSCPAANGQAAQRQAMVGSYTAETLQLAVSGESATPGTDTMPSFPVRIESTLTGRRVGDCPAGSAN